MKEGLESTLVYGPLHLPASSTTLMTDADEEVFLLYTSAAARTPLDGSGGFRGLGYVDSHKDTLTFEFVIPPPGTATDPERPVQETRSGKTSRKKAKRPPGRQERVISVELFQDKTALHSRKGDTGSVVWLASVDFTQYVLRQYYAGTPDALVNPASLQNAHVLELGAGTGLLSVALSPLVARYTVTDMEALIPLIQKNLTLNLPKFSPACSTRRPAPSRRVVGQDSSANIIVEALDWEILHRTSASARRSLFQYPPVDLLVVVDCIYHPSLLPALLSTIEHLTTPGLTAVLVVIELRAEDVVREFLRQWLDLSPNGEWRIWSVSDVLKGPYAVWVGWKNKLIESTAGV